MRPNLPQLTTAVIGWADHVMIGLVCKSQENFKTVESILTKRYKAVLQPSQAKQLHILPEGQRGWKWYQMHAEPSLQLEVDDIVIIDHGHRYRVMAKSDYSAYGFMEYELVRGYENL
jgi:hypothetical protein